MVLGVLSPKEKRQLLLLTPAVVVMALMDVAGIASIVPFLGLLSDPDAIENSRALSWLYAELAFETRESFFFAVGLGVLLVLTLGNAFSALTTWGLLRFSWMRNHSISVRLIETYMRRPYAWFLTQNTAQLGQKVLAEVQAVVSGIIVQLINLSARAVVIVLVLCTLLAIDPLMAVGVGLGFGGIYGTLFWAVRRRLAVISKERVVAGQARYRLANEMLAGIKEVKLAGLESTFLRRYAEPSRAYSDVVARNQTLTQLPRYALETVAFGGVLVMVLFVLRTGRQLNDVLPVVGLYAFASYRMLPGLQQVFAGVASIRANLTALEVLVAELGSGPRAPAPQLAELAFDHEVALERVSFAYEGVGKPALDDVNLSIGRGEWIALVGPTGSGKSTLVDLLLGLLRTTEGTVCVDGEPITDANLTAWQRSVGYVPQQIFLADDTIARNIAFGDDDVAVDEARLQHVAQVAQIHAFIEQELPLGYRTEVGERGVRLSGGQRQRLGIARALYREPKFLVLDEATSALDNDTEARFFEDLRSSLDGVSVVSIAHRLSTTRVFDRIYVVEAGQIVDAGSFEELSRRSPVFASRGAGRAVVPEEQAAC